MFFCQPLPYHRYGTYSWLSDPDCERNFLGYKPKCLTPLYR